MSIPSFLVILFGIILVYRFYVFYRRWSKDVIFTETPKRDIVAEMRADYANALAELRQNPTSPTVHEKALYLGRLYAAATREHKAVTLFDETALANDIRAATANASQQVANVQPAIARTPSLDERINALKKLKESGLISDEEFAQKRKEILDSI